MKKFAILILVAALVFCTACSGTSRAVSKIKSAVEDGDLSAAFEVYEEKIAGDGDAMTEVNTMLHELIADVTAKYEAGEWDFDTALNKLDSIATFPSVRIAAYEALDRLSELQHSTDVFNDAKDAIASADFPTAIDLLDEVTTESKEFAEAQALLEDSAKQYRDEITAEVNAFLQQKQFDNAKVMLDKGLQVLGQDAALLALDMQITEARLQTLLEEATALLETDLSGAIAKLNEALTQFPDDPKLLSALLSAKTTFVEKALADAEAIAITGDYDSAIEALTIAKSVIDDEALQQAIDTYQSYMPVYLADLDYFESYKGFTRAKENLTDNLGNAHNKPIGVGDSYGYNGPPNVYEVYKLNAGYERMTGCFYLRYINRNDKKSGTLNIYGNDKLLYTSSGMKAGVEPVTFDIDLTGVDLLKVEFDTGREYACGYFQLGDAILYPVPPQ